ncbi:MAG: hypothetical protein H0X02_01675 [Nitrosomonas sp.]|nr:hypothetical protein [Nitrosomonas sp.]
MRGNVHVGESQASHQIPAELFSLKNWVGILHQAVRTFNPVTPPNGQSQRLAYD